MPALVDIIAVVFCGLIWGSFLNVVIYRLPQTTAAGLRADAKRGLSFLALPLSFCPACRAPIPPQRNIPVLTYLLQRGRAHCCGGRISARYPLVELCGAAIIALAVWRQSGVVDIFLTGAFLSFLFALAVIDWQRYYLLDILTLPLLWLGLLANLDARFALLPDAVLGAAAGYLFLAGVAALFSLAVGRQAMGGGDFKLFAALGAWVGWHMLPMLLFIAAVFGSLLGGARFLARGRARRIPFGPCLAAAGALMLLFGAEIMRAYWEFIAA